MSQSQARPVMPGSPVEHQKQAGKKTHCFDRKKDQKEKQNSSLKNKWQQTTEERGALLSVTLVNVAQVVGPEERASCNIERQSHWVGDRSLDDVKVSRLHVHQPHRSPLHGQQSHSATWGAQLVNLWTRPLTRV